MSGENDLLIDLESMKNILVARATGPGGDDMEYGRLRLRLLRSPVGDRLPRFVHTCRSLSEFWGFIQPKYSSYRERREFLAGEFNPLLSVLEEGPSPAHAQAAAAFQRMSSEFVQKQWQKTIDRRTNDPDGAITAARTLLESVCKHILDDLGREYSPGTDLPALYRLTAEGLQLAPSQHTENVFKQILGACTAVVEGLGALRNRVGDAHGQGTRQVRPAPRHAELAVNLAGAMAMFLLATFEARRATE